MQRMCNLGIKKLLQYSLYLACCACFFTTAWAQNKQAEPHWRPLSTDLFDVNSGLPISTINGLTFGPDKQLWIATWEGLVEFDGTRFDTLPLSQSEERLNVGFNKISQGCSAAVVTSSPRGDLFIHRKQHPQFLFQEADLPTLLQCDHNDNLWSSSRTAIAIHSLTTGEKLQDLHFEKYGHKVYSFYQLNSDSVLLGTTTGLYRSRKIAGQWQSPQLIHDGIDVRSIITSNSRLWIGTTQGLYASPLKAPQQLKLVARDLWVTSLAQDKSGELLVGTFRKGLFKIVDAVTPELRQVDTGKIKKISQILVDERGYIWLATYQGLLKLSEKPFYSIGVDQGFSSDFIRTILPINQNEIAIGTSTGLYIYDVDERAVKQKLLQGKSILSLAKYTDASLLIGTFGSGLYQWSFDHQPTNYLDETSGLASNQIRAIVVKENGEILLATGNGANLILGDRQIKSYLLGEFTTHMAIHDNELYVSSSNGLWFYQADTDQFQPVEIGNAKMVFAVEKINSERYALTDTGIYYQDSPSTFFPIDANCPFVSQKFFAAYTDSQGSVWLTSNRGIITIEQNDFTPPNLAALSCSKITHYTVSSGLATSQMNGLSNPSISQFNSELYFASSKGVAIFDLSNEFEASGIENVLLSEIRVDGKPFPINSELKLPIGAKRLSFEFHSVHFSGQENLFYEVRLQGFESQWNQLNNTTTIDYTNLPPGSYKVEVRASLDQKQWSYLEHSLRVIVPKEFWQQHWFYGAMIALLILIIRLYLVIRMYFIRRHEKELKAALQIKTKELKVKAEKFEQLAQERQELADKLTQKTQSLSTQARTDSLTGLFNRFAFDEALKTRLSDVTKQNTNLCLAIFDIDHFKHINDHWSHLVGDQVLQAVAETLKQATRDTDICARWGGEEFILLMPNVDLNTAESICERIRVSIATNDLSDIAAGLNVTISAGVTSLQPNMREKSFLALADKALYLAKNTGRNCVHTCVDIDALS